MSSVTTMAVAAATTASTHSRGMSAERTRIGADTVDA